MISQISELLEKIPYTLLAFLFVCYLGYDYYEFSFGESSVLHFKNTELENTKKLKEAAIKKNKSLEEFSKNVEGRKSNLVGLVSELQSLKDSLPERIDVPLAMKTLVTEAKRVGLKVTGISPNVEVPRDLYVEQPFSMGIKGYYPQIWAFFDRLANVTQVVRVDRFELRPVGDQSSGRVLLQGELEVKLFRYLGAKADQLAKTATQTAQSPSSKVTQPAAAASSTPGGVH